MIVFFAATVFGELWFLYFIPQKVIFLVLHAAIVSLMTCHDTTLRCIKSCPCY